MLLIPQTGLLYYGRNRKRIARAPVVAPFLMHRRKRVESTFLIFLPDATTAEVRL